MSAPGCTIVLREPLNELRRDDVRDWLSALGRVSVWTESGLEVVDARGHQVDVWLGEPTPAYAEAVRRVLGWAPAQFIGLSGINSGTPHAFVGRAALVLAGRLPAWVRLGTICDLGDEPIELSEEARDHLNRLYASIHPEDRDDPDAVLRWIMETADPRVADAIARDFDRRVREKATGNPGEFHELREESSTSYLVNAAYLSGWLEDPGFILD